MTPRVEMIALDIKATLPEVKRTIEESGHSRLPVYEESLDHIVGILYARIAASPRLAVRGLRNPQRDAAGAVRAAQQAAAKSAA
jgi:CBS domain containing-hemolysin-like protein